jgi:hypothetical protein
MVIAAAKLTILTHKTAIQLHLVAESCTICCSRSRRPVRKLLVTPLYFDKVVVLGEVNNVFIYVKSIPLTALWTLITNAVMTQRPEAS